MGKKVSLSSLGLMEGAVAAMLEGGGGGSMPNKREGLWGDKQFRSALQPSLSLEKRDFSVSQILIMKCA